MMELKEIIFWVIVFIVVFMIIQSKQKRKEKFLKINKRLIDLEKPFKFKEGESVEFEYYDYDLCDPQNPKPIVLQGIIVDYSATYFDDNSIKGSCYSILSGSTVHRNVSETMIRPYK